MDAGCCRFHFDKDQVVDDGIGEEVTEQVTAEEDAKRHSFDH